MPEILVKDEENVAMFGDVDRNKKGDIASSMPAWYFRSQIETLENDISLKRSAIERQHLTGEDRARAVSEVKKLEERLSSITGSKPKMTGKTADTVNKVSKELGEKIGDAMFTHTAMMKGTADARDEVDRATLPCVKLSNEALRVAEQCNCKINHRGEVSRDDATRVWKMCQRLRGESTDAEILRRG